MGIWSPYQVINDYPLKPSLSYGGRYNVGDDSNSLDKGTIVYDGADDIVTHQIVDQYTDIAVVKRRSYWAQGGISMTLNNDSNWQSIMQAQQLPSPTWSTLRGLLWHIKMILPLLFMELSLLRTACRENSVPPSRRLIALIMLFFWIVGLLHKYVPRILTVTLLHSVEGEIFPKKWSFSIKELLN